MQDLIKRLRSESPVQGKESRFKEDDFDMELKQNRNLINRLQMCSGNPKENVRRISLAIIDL